MCFCSCATFKALLLFLYWRMANRRDFKQVDTSIFKSKNDLQQVLNKV